MKYLLTIVNLQVGRAGGGLSPGRRDPAGVLAGVPRAAVADLQGEQGVLAGDLQSVRQSVVQRLVVLQPGGGDSGTSAGPGLECCLLAGWKFAFYFNFLILISKFSGLESQAERKKKCLVRTFLAENQNSLLHFC